MWVYHVCDTNRPTHASIHKHPPSTIHTHKHSGSELDHAATLRALAIALLPTRSLPTPGPADVMMAETVAGPAIGPSLSPFPHPCPLPRLRLLDVRQNQLGRHIPGPEQALEGKGRVEGAGADLRRTLRARRRWSRRWNELQRKGADGRIAMLRVLV